MKNNAKNVVKMPEASFYNGVPCGLGYSKPLFKKKTHTPFKDIDYFEALGRYCLNIDAQNKSNLPSDYGELYRPMCEVAKNVCTALDSGASRSEVANYIKLCIDLNS